VTTPLRTALTIAGSDSGGGAGLQADLKTFAAHRVFGLCAVTAVTAQNTVGVHRVDLLSADSLRAQLKAVFDDIPVHAIKIGMLGDADQVHAVADALRQLTPRPPIVLDPVLLSSSGAQLLSPRGVDALGALIPLCTLITPNAAEARVLAGDTPLADWATTLGPAVLVTGGDEPGITVRDTRYALDNTPRTWTAPRLSGGPVHGTGCALSSAIAARIACGEATDDAIDGAIRWVRDGIAGAAPLGAGARVMRPQRP